MNVANSPPTPWWETVRLRDEINYSRGGIDDMQASLHDAVFGRADGAQGLYGNADRYGQITHPTRQPRRTIGADRSSLGLPGASIPAGTCGVATRPGNGPAANRTGLLACGISLRTPTTWQQPTWEKQYSAVLTRLPGRASSQATWASRAASCWDCDNPEPREKVDGPATTLGERFLWRLFGRGPTRSGRPTRTTPPNKESLAEAIYDVGRPVLILIDEVMAYIRWASKKPDDFVTDDMTFLGALLDVVNDVDNCVLVVVMIASERDRTYLNPTAQKCRNELEDLLVRNGETTTVSGGGDFAEIIRRRLFANEPPVEVVSAAAGWFSDHMPRALASRRVRPARYRRGGVRRAG